MIVGVGEIDPAPTEMVVDLVQLRSRGIGPKSQTLSLDLPKAGVELRVADQEGVMLRRDGAFLLVEIKGYAVLKVNDEEVEESPRRRKSKDVD